MKRIYLDNAALTPIDKRVLKEMVKYYGSEYGNPSSIHKEGVHAARALSAARKQCAEFLHAHSDEIIFTASGTEANAIAIEGTVLHHVKNGLKAEDIHLIVSSIEHPSVLEAALKLKEKGIAVDFISVTEDGLFNLDELAEKISPKTVLISLMLVNNEIGTIEPIAEAAKLVRKEKKRRAAAGETRALSFHTDASQAALYENVYVEKLGVDLLTLDAHKVYGPRGVGLLFVKRGTPLLPIISGGGQENGLRSGTENIPSIMGFAKALMIAKDEREQEIARLTELRNYFMSSLKELFSEQFRNMKFNGSVRERIANNINVSFGDVDNEFIVLQLDARGIACSTKSSCLHDEDDSYVIAALNKTGEKKSHNTNALRFSLGRFTTKGDIKKTVAALTTILLKK